MNDLVTPAPMAPVVRIGVRGLPNLTDNMTTGGLYVLIAATPSARFPILAGSLGSALSDDLPCTVIVPVNPELFVQRIESFGHLNLSEVIANERLQIFVMQDEFPKKMFRFGTESFLKELEEFKVLENSYLIFDQADELLSLHDISLALEQIDVLKKWFEARKVTALLVFSRATEAHSGTINALMDSLTGIVRLGGDRNGLELTFDYWQSPDGTIAARNYRLLTLESGLYEASTKIESQEQNNNSSDKKQDNDTEPDTEDTEVRFFYMDPDLASLAKQVAGTWQWVDTLVGMMHATRNTRSSTSILCFQHNTNLRQLAETVHTLRLSMGRHAQIVVQEKGASLRYQNEALLLRLGVSLVVHRDVSVNRLPLLLESIKGQIFNRDVDINFEAALASVTPTRLRGYLLPLRFAREVNLILERTETLNIPCAMIVGKPVQGTVMIDLLTHITLSRPGDLITADQEYCYLFLNACPQPVMLATLERILGSSVDAVFEQIRFLVERSEIDPELAALTRSAEQGRLPDYSALSEEPLAQDPSLARTPELPPAPVAPTPALVRHVPVAPISAISAISQRLAAPLLPAARASRHMTPDLPAAKRLAATAVAPAAMPHNQPKAPAPTPPVPMPTSATPPVIAAPEPNSEKKSSFSYNNAHAGPSFGKKEVPRATRSSLGTAPPTRKTTVPPGL